MEEKGYLVYKHTSPSNKVYIGITSRTLEERSGHNGIHYKKNKNAHFWEAIQKYGWNNFEHEVLCKNLTKKEASEKEQYFINLYKSNKREFGYNLTSGGEMSFSQNKEIKEQLSKKAKEQWANPQIRAKMIERLKISHIGVFTEKQKQSVLKRRGKPLPKERVEKMRGKPAWNKDIKKCWSPEVLKKMSKSHLGKSPSNKGTHLTDEQKKIVSIRTREGMNNPIVKAKLSEAQHKRKGKTFKNYIAQYDLQNNLIEIHKGYENASRKTKINKTAIRQCALGKNKTSGGFIWKIITKEEYKNEIIKNI